MEKLNIKVSRIGVPQDEQCCLKKYAKLTACGIIAISLCVILFHLFMCLELYIRNIYSVKPYSEANTNTWISSAASYWGGIIGGALSGIISLFGTFIIINYYRKSDISNKQTANQPFINIKLVKTYTQKPTDINDYIYLCDIGEGEKTVYTHVELRNVGKSFARTVVYYNGSNFGGNEFQYVVEAGESLDEKLLIGVKYSNSDVESSLGIMFLDCFLNEYIQVFNFKVDNSASVNVMAEYPNLTQSAFK